MTEQVQALIDAAQNVLNRFGSFPKSLTEKQILALARLEQVLLDVEMARDHD